ncbi:MAG TPA: acetate uptake transporter [Jatrophihabitans sp.]|jgi:hypothetical protein|uniref:acetate uptake transporter n=1 Tax=Jatrophihabitans sp. TaxID=1932789 RepID=UPI002E067CA8|nr:acetate uptake transporter [Jatrophihabitans sp.]
MAQDMQSTPRPTPAAAGGLASIADPGPLGLAGFAATTFFLSVVNARLLPATVEAGVLGLAFFYGGIAQVLAGMWEFAKGNTFGAVAFTSYGAFWLSFWYLITKGVPAFIAAKATATDINHAVGTFLLVWTIFTIYMTIAALRTSIAVLSVFVVLSATFLFLTIGNFGGSEGIIKVGGWLGLATAALAWYASLAGVANSTFKRPVFPVLPR